MSSSPDYVCLLRIVLGLSTDANGQEHPFHNFMCRIIVSTLTTKKPFPPCLFRETAFCRNKVVRSFFLLSWYPTNVFPGKGRSTMPDYPAANVQTMP